MRLFVAVDIPEELRERLKPLLNLLSRYRGIKPVEPENLHITLKFLGEVNDARAELVKDRLRKVEFDPFTIRFRGIGFFPRPDYMRVIWVGVEGEGIYKLAEKIEKEMRKLGFKKDREFRAHLTVGRVKRIDADLRMKLAEELKEFNRDYGEFTVEEFRLKRSTLTPKGPIYDDVEVFGGRT